MALAQDLIAIIIFWAIIGGLGASLLLPAMQSLIHGNFEGPAQMKAYALVGAVGGDRGGRRPADRRVHHDLPVVADRVPARGRGHPDRAPGHRADPRHPVHRAAGSGLVGALLSVVGMGGIVLSILAWQDGGEAVGALFVVGIVAMASLVWWLMRRKREDRSP